MRLPIHPLLRFAALAATTTTGAAQQPLSLRHFDGAESWPLRHPGELAFDNSALHPLRIRFDGLFPGPGGFGRGPLDSLSMYLDALEVSFHAQPAVLVQWTSTSPPYRPTEAAALDLIVVDRATFNPLFRIARSGPADTWAGQYELVQAMPERITQVTVDDDGTTARAELARSRPLFDFGSYPFLFPFLKLEPGFGVRLAGYDYLAKQEEVLAVKVVGKTTIRDAAGAAHEVEVDVLPPHRAVLITFYVSEQAPFFYGWRFRVVRDGRTALQMTYRGWADTRVGTGTEP